MMPRDRSSHQQKTHEERKFYWATTIRGVAPTIETVPPTDEPTDATAVSEPEPVGSLTATYRPSWLARQFKEDPVRLIVAPLLVLLLSWFGVTLFNLNREVGQLSVEVSGVKKSGEATNRELEKVEARVRSDNHTIADRLREFEKYVQAKLEALRPGPVQRK